MPLAYRGAPALAGAWSRTGEPVERLLPESRRRALAGGFRPSFERLEGPLWLGAERDAACARDGRVAARAGWLAGGRAALDALASSPKPDLRGDGPHVLVWADPTAGLLSLARDPSGAERLYFAEDGPLLLFCTRARPLLAALGRPAAVDAEAAFERGLCELPVFGDASLFAGLRELLAGHRLDASPGPAAQAWQWGETILARPEGTPAELARQFRERLFAAVAGALDGISRVGVSLSGGIDSSTVAAFAAEILGPDRVHAFTYEFEDPEHPSEAPFAAAACRHLGIRSHAVIRLGFDEYAAELPAAVWASEDPAFWRRPAIPRLARHAAEEGCELFLTGCGIDSYLGYFERFAARLPEGPVDRLNLARESLDRPEDDDIRRRVEHRARYAVLCALRAAGRVADIGSHFPAELSATVERASRSARVSAALAALEALPLGRRLQRLCQPRMNYSIDLVRDERLARESGAPCLSPGHFASCMAHGQVLSGQVLLQEAMRGQLPREVLERPKYWPHTVGSRRWRDRILQKMADAAAGSLEALGPLFGGKVEAFRRYSPEGVVPLAFWREVCVGRADKERPTWEALGVK